jgi:hypothetical protein
MAFSFKLMSSYTVHYIDCTLSFALISCLKQEIAFHCQTINDICNMNISNAYQILKRKKGMQYRSRFNILYPFGSAIFFKYIYKGRLVKISENIAFLFYKEIYMKYLIL